MVETVVDLVLAPLLLLTTLWCALVHQRLRRLRGDRLEIQDFILALGEATMRAEQVVAELREAASQSQAVLGERQTALRRERDEVARLLENAGRVTRRLEAEVTRGTRGVADVSATAERRPPGLPEQRAVPDRAPPAPPAPRLPRVGADEAGDLLAMARGALPGGGEPVEESGPEHDPARRGKRQRVGAELLRALQALR